MRKVPSTDVPVGNNNAPAFIVRLLNVMAVVPFTVPAVPEKLTVPVPLVKVPLLVSVPAFPKLTVPVPPVNVPLLTNEPDADIFNVPAADQLSILLLVTNGVVKLPVPPKVNVPALVTDVETVIEPLVLTTKVLPELMVTVAGLETVVFKLKSLAMVTVAPVGGTVVPNQEDAVAHVDAPDCVM